MLSRLWLVTLLALALPSFALPAPASADQGDCGQPLSTGARPVASDALLVLNTAVGRSQCDLCICDVDRTGAIRATDALAVLKTAVGTPGLVDCVSCPVTGIIGAAGGEIVLDGGEARLVIPPGALDADTEVTFTGVAPPLLGPGLAALDSRLSFRVEPDDLEFALPPRVEILVDSLQTQAGFARGSPAFALLIADLFYGVDEDSTTTGTPPPLTMLEQQQLDADGDSGMAMFSADLRTKPVPFAVAPIDANQVGRSLEARVAFIDEQTVGEAVTRGHACAAAPLHRSARTRSPSMTAGPT